MNVIWHIVIAAEDPVGRTAALIIGMALGYMLACVRATMRYARVVRREVHQIHVELRRVEQKIERYHPEGNNDDTAG